MSLLPMTETSLTQLRDLARLRTQQVPSLGMMLRYLELTPRQSYLVQRVQGEATPSGPSFHIITVYSFTELAQGGCIGAYRWNTGSSPDSDTPSDAEVKEREGGIWLP